MNRKVDRKFLKQAKANKNDEFYTQYSDIERELAHYEGHFAGKVVYCNCDHAESNFVAYFRDNFVRLGLKGLIASCFVGSGFSGSTSVGSASAGFASSASASAGSASAGSSSALLVGQKWEYYLDHDRLVCQHKLLAGDGDFRSAECLELLGQADLVVTNPPFSLFRDWVAVALGAKKQFLAIGNINCITYKEIFAAIQAGQAWLGINLGCGISGFLVPEHYQLYGTECQVNEQGQRIVATNSCLWLTNLDHNKRHEPLPLVKSYKENPEAYPHYDNCDAINVGKTADIPYDYHGLMGVPITFLHKFNPEQFELVRFRKGDDGKDLRINGKCPYFRILIKPVE